MPRQPRIHCPGALYHVMLRGNNRTEIFFDDGDRLFFEKLIEDSVERFSCRVHAYVLMSNHIHLAIQVADIALSDIMQVLSLRYTRWVNKKYQRVGHVFQGRYRCLLVDSNSYLLELTRYIHLNPVRAFIVAHVSDYRWSSYTDYIAPSKCRKWLTTHVALQLLSQLESKATIAYTSFCATNIDEEVLENLSQCDVGGKMLGDDHFIDALQKFTARSKKNLDQISLDALVDQIGKKYGIPKTVLTGASRARSVSAIRKEIYQTFVSHGGCLSELATYFNRDISTISKHLSR